MLPLIPLGNRVLIRPDPKPTETTSGLEVVRDWEPDMSGIVVAVGRVHPRQAEALAVARELERDASEAAGEAAIDQDDLLDYRAASLLRALVSGVSDVSVGDRVLFSWTAGQELRIGDEGKDRLLMMRETDILAVLEPVEAMVKREAHLACAFQTEL